MTADSQSLVPRLPYATAATVGKIVRHLRDLLVDTASDDGRLRQAAQHFDDAASQSLRTREPLHLHPDAHVNGWLLHGAKTLLARHKAGQGGARLRDIAGRLAQAGAIAPLGMLGGAYHLLGKVGAGGYGTVWRAIRTHGPEIVAIKLCNGEAGQPPDPALVASLRKESICLQRLGEGGGHPSIPRFIACDFDRREPHLVMEFVEGQRLGDWLRTNPPQVQREHVLRAILSALEHAHGLEIYHRDLKNENILVCTDGGATRTVVLDWGIAKTELPEQQTMDPQHLANVRNSAPECINHSRERHGAIFPYGAVQDIWSFGVIAYHVLTGRHPFEVPRDVLNTEERILRHDPSPLPQSVGPWLPLVAAMLIKDPAQRMQSCDAVWTALDPPEVEPVNADDVVDRLIQELGPTMVHSNEWLGRAMAMTNATGFGLDDHYVNRAEYNSVSESIDFEADLNFSGDHDPDHIWCGDTIRMTIEGRATRNGEDWTLADYSVLECESNAGDE